MADIDQSLVAAKELVVARKGNFQTDLVISDPHGVPLGSVRQAGNKWLLFLHDISDGLFFPSRPFEVRDREDRPLLWIEQRGVLRRNVITVQRADRTVIGRLVGKTWGSAIRMSGYWLELDEQRVGELAFDKPGYRILDIAGVELGRTGKFNGEATGRQNGTTLQRVELSDALASLAVAAMINRHVGG